MMDKRRWQKIQELFEQAVQRDDNEREAFLKKECGADADLYGEITSLLAADKNIAPVLHQSLGSAAKDLTESTDYSKRLLGKMLGEYRIESIIAAGGMGTVYKARRADGSFEQEVAVKVIHHALTTTRFVDRFRRERQILARLDHPNIARLLDGGLTDDGLPFLVMELIDGQSLDVYCSGKNLSIDQKLKIFLQICKAVNYAHNHLIIHRDLKPGNIFITAYGKVKLLDFGIAKVFADDEPGLMSQTLTSDERAPFTPEYAAPEQIDHDEISVTTDVYALGVILYELLTGQRPYEITTVNPVEIQKIILENIPSRPSTLVLRQDSGHFIRHSARLLSRRLRGDLDNICLMALKKESSQRYQNVQQFSDDIKQHLQGRPVQASGDFLWYRLKKYTQRHRLGLSLGAVFILILSGLVLFYTIMLREQTHQARQEAEKARAVSDFLGSLFEAASPEEAQGKNISARDLLEAGAFRIETELVQEPEVQATMLHVIGDVYRRIADFDRAEQLLQKALERKETLYGIQSTEVVEALSHLGELYLQTGQYEKSASYLDRAIQSQDEIDPEENIVKGELLHRKADLVFELGQYAQADSFYAICQNIYQNHLGPEHELIAGILNARASVARHKEDFAAAETLYRQALKMRRKLLGDEHPDVAHTLNHLGRLMYKMGKYQEGEVFAREGLALRQKIFGLNNPETGASMSNLAHLLFQQGKYAEAETYYRQVAGIMKKVFTDPHPYKAITQSNLGNVLYHLKRYDEAEKILRGSLKQLQNLLPENHIRMTSTQLRLGLLLLDKDNFEDARKLIQSAYNIRNKALSEENQETAEAESALGYYFARVGNYQKAQTHLQHSDRILKKVKREDDPLIRASRERLAYLESKTGR